MLTVAARKGRKERLRCKGRTDHVVRALGLVEVFWDVDARDDVPHARVRDIVRNVEQGLRPGAIVLMHDIHPWTLKALPLVLRAIHDRGLRAVSVSELLAIDPPAAVASLSDFFSLATSLADLFAVEGPLSLPASSACATAAPRRHAKSVSVLALMTIDNSIHSR